MSSDLVTANEISTTVQSVASQNGTDSALAIGSSQVQVNTTGTSNSPLQVLNKDGNAALSAYVGGSSNGNLLIKKADGTTMVRLAAGTFTSYINNGTNVGIGTSSPEAQLDVQGTLQASGQITLTGMQLASSAPTPETLKVVLVDTNTGILYHQ